jgi:uncharacterized protein (DUF1697 family)
MIFVALLRGVNVGGSNVVSMAQLRAVFEEAGFGSVRTYINSGNVIFSTDETDREVLARRAESGIAERFGLHVRVLLRDAAEVAAIVAAIPCDWANDDRQKCDVLFLWPEVDRPAIIDEVGARLGVDDLRYVAGAMISRVSRADVGRSGLLKLMGSPLYRQMTIRNCNTARKLLELMSGPTGAAR